MMLFAQVTKQDFNRLEQDVTGLKQDVTILKQDVAVLKQDVSVIKHDIKMLETKTDAKLAHLKADMLKYMIGISTAQAALIVSFIKFIP